MQQNYINCHTTITSNWGNITKTKNLNRLRNALRKLRTFITKAKNN